MTSNLTGKRMRSETEFDSDMKSFGSNSQGQDTLSNMDGDVPTKILEEVTKCRLRMHPYKDVGGWNDKELWDRLKNQLYLKGHPLTHKTLMEVIIKWERIYLGGQLHKLNISDFLCICLNVVFGPVNDIGPLRTCQLDASFLPHISKVTRVTELLSSNDVMPIGWQKTILSPKKDNTAEVLLPTRKDKKKREKVVESKVTYVDQTDLLDMYNQDIQHFSAEEKGRLLYNISPSSAEYHIMAKKPPHLRKAAFYRFQEISKDAPVQQRPSPSFPTVNQQN